MALLDRRVRSDPRRRATEEAFLRATQALLDEGASFADLNVTRISTRAGRTRTSFYAHFEDRRELLLALVEDAGDDAIAALAPSRDAPGPLTYDDLVASNRALLAAFERHAGVVRAVIEAAGYDEPVAAHWSAIVGDIIAGARRLLEDTGHDPDAAAAKATALVWMTERTCYQQVFGGTNLDDEQVVAALSEVWWSALQSRRPPGGVGAD